MQDDVLAGFEWNEASITQRARFLEGLVSLIAFGPDRSPKPIGTGFIVAASGNSAIAVTAAHNFSEGIRQVQNPEPGRHPTALAEFLPRGEEISLDRKKVRAIYVAGERVEICVMGFAAWDRTADVAVFALRPQDVNDKTVFKAFHQLGGVAPQVGEVVGLLGFGGMEIGHEYRDGKGFESAMLASRLVLRAGRVKARHEAGHLLCRGPCLETTIPVFPGMSGGPVFCLPEADRPINPFGLISSDPEEPINLKNDRSRAGSSIVSLLPHEIVSDTGEKREIVIELSDAYFARNPESDFLP